ncbi:MAG: DUF411 domain-containing protein [Gemmatimonadetes bacterium]|nr:DUF411 domain-containing protein [Gemmatimonadota bacterium]
MKATRRWAIWGTGAVIAVASAAAGAATLQQKGEPQKRERPEIRVFKTAACGCCRAWVDHLQRQGFKVAAEDVTPAVLDETKRKLGVVPKLAACHTAVVSGYVVEGHVPAVDILRLLKERPRIAGLAAPGMPIGSPGMEGPNPQPYNVLAFDSAGRLSVFSRH